MGMFAPPVIKLCRIHLFDYPKVGEAALTCSYCKFSIPFSQFKNECGTVGRMLMDANVPDRVGACHAGKPPSNRIPPGPSNMDRSSMCNGLPTPYGN